MNTRGVSNARVDSLLLATHDPDRATLSRCSPPAAADIVESSFHSRDADVRARPDLPAIKAGQPYDADDFELDLRKGKNHSFARLLELARHGTQITDEVAPSGDLTRGPQ